MVAVLKCKCPKCRESHIFCDTNPYHLSKLFLMPEHCPTCGLKFNKEPGFFYGAMYVGYGISVAYLVAFYVAMLVPVSYTHLTLVLLNDFEVETYLLSAIISLFLLTPVIFRVSRSIWLFMFEKFDATASKEWKALTKGKDIENPCIEV